MAYLRIGIHGGVHGLEVQKILYKLAFFSPHMHPGFKCPQQRNTPNPSHFVLLHLPLPLHVPILFFLVNFVREKKLHLPTSG